MLRNVGRLTASLIALFCSGIVLPAQDARPTREGQPAGVGQAADPYVVYETTPVILHGPYLLAPTETSVVIVWTTDTPCHSKVLYGITEPTMEANNAEDGMLPVGATHSVRITGLKPGQSYRYQVVSTRVVKLKGYWPDKSLFREKPCSSPFTTFDASRPTTAFYAITDTHEDVPRIETSLKMADWKSADFLLNLGDAFNTVESEDQMFAKWLDPIMHSIGSTIPFVYARGNHDTRGPFARNLSTFLPFEEGRYYYSRDSGPVHLMVVDTGEDKPDSTNVYAHLNDFAPYREQELAWLEEHTRSSQRVAEAPFRIVAMHQPMWGSVEDGNQRWTDWANRSKVDLVIAGHTHRYAHIQPGQRGNNYPILVVGQGQLAKVEATATQLQRCRARGGRIDGRFVDGRTERHEREIAGGQVLHRH